MAAAAFGQVSRGLLTLLFAASPRLSVVCAGFPAESLASVTMLSSEDLSWAAGQFGFPETAAFQRQQLGGSRSVGSWSSLGLWLQSSRAGLARCLEPFSLFLASWFCFLCLTSVFDLTLLMCALVGLCR